MFKKYHLVAEGSDKDSLTALRLLDKNGISYVLTLVDNCPDYFYFLKNTHSVDAVPMVFQYISGFEEYKLIGGLEALQDHLAEITE